MTLARWGFGVAPRSERRGPSLLVVAALAAAGVAAAVVSVLLAVTSDHLSGRGVQLALINWITLPFLIAGLVAWRRRPESRLGPLMVAAGFLTWLSTLQWSNAAVAYSIGQVVDLLVAAVYVHVFLAFPTGLLNRVPERVLVLATYTTALGLQFVKLMLGADPANLIGITSEPTLANLVEKVQLSTLAVLCLAGAALLVVRAHQDRRIRRRPVRMLIDAFGVGLVMLAALFVAAALEWQATEQIRYLTFLVLGLSPLAFLLGLLDARLARANVGELLVELRADPGLDLRQAMARALRDPSLTLAYWLPEYGVWADRDGRSVPPPNDTPERAFEVIYRDGQPVAALTFDGSLREEPELVDAVKAAAAIALDNDRLQVELRARLQELHESRARMLVAGQLERQRLERNLHDGAQQRLVALSLELALVEARLDGDEESTARLSRARHEIAVSLQELREVASGLYPAVLSGHGLQVALESITDRCAVPVRLDIAIDGRPPAPVEAAAYYVVCEALTNIDKHGEATQAQVAVAMANGNIVIEVVDDGIGGADAEKGSGLRGLADRVESLGGHLRVWSSPGQGTRLSADIPCG